MKEDEKILKFLNNTCSIAVIGMKDNDYEISYRVSEYLSTQGYEIYPVNPKKAGKEALGRKFSVKVSEIEEKIDLVQIFRRPEFLPAHASEILKMKQLPKYVWFQMGIYSHKAANMLEENGIEVIQDRCMFVEHRRLKNRLAEKDNG
jgi:predicted CoA-binding protein